MKYIIIILWIIIILLLVVNISFNHFSNNNIHFIHIGKTGGTTIGKIFKFKKSHHHKPPRNNNLQYIVSVRNPIKRLVSAFNMIKQAINTDYSKPKPTNYVSDFNNVKKRLLKNGYIYSEKFDEYFKEFDNVNQLFEELPTNKHAQYLFENNVPHQHISKGIGFYLSNGDFVDNNHDNIIYVTRNEYLDEDIKKLGEMLNININTYKSHRLSNNKKEYLSPKAIENIKTYLKDTDYKALESLRKYDLISQEYLDYCYTYKN